MTDKNNISQNANTNTTKKSIVDSPKTVTTESKPSNKAGVITGAVAILLTLGLTAGLYYHSHQQNQQQQQMITALQTQLQNSQRALTEKQQLVATKLAQTTQQLGLIKKSEQLTASQLETIQLAVANLKMRNPNEWMLAEAEYLIRMAGRKIALEQDTETSLALLVSANLRVAELNDPSLLPLRKVIEQDINTLAKLPHVDRDGIALILSTQIQAVDDLTLAGLTRPEIVLTDNIPSNDIADWKENLKKSWHKFTAEFITIRQQNDAVEALLPPKTAWYLAENLKTKLLQAELALYRQDQSKYSQSLTTAIEWITRYYDPEQQATKTMLATLKTIKDSPISIDYPHQLQSSSVIQTTIKDRKINALTNTDKVQ